MKILLLLLFALLGLGGQVSCQNYQVFYTGNEQQGGNQFGSTPAVQNPFSSSPSPFPAQNEVLGNFFNGRVPSSEQPILSPFTHNRFQQSPLPPHQNQQQQQNQPQHQQQLFPLQNNYLSPPISTSIPRETHFFGNNYDFFRQFHQIQPNQQQTPNNVFQQQQPLRHSSHQTTLDNFFNNQGTTPTLPSVPSPSTTAPSYTSTQYVSPPAEVVRSQPQNAYTFTVGQGQTQTSPQYSTSPQSPEPTHRIPTHRTPISYPLTVVKHTQEVLPPQQNSVYNGYEEAAKALGITHGLRVVTTETLNSHPTVEIATASEAPFLPRISSTSQTLPSLPPTESSYVPITEEPTTTTTTTQATTTSTTTEASTTTPAPRTTRTRLPVQIVTSTEIPYNSRQRQPLYRQSNRVVSTNDINLPATTYRPAIVTAFPTSTTTITTPQPIIQNFQNVYEEEPYRQQFEIGPQQQVHNGRPLLSQPQQQSRDTTTTSTPKPIIQNFQNVYEEEPYRQQFEIAPQQEVRNGRPLPNSQGHGLYNFNNLTPGLLYTNTNGAYQPYYNNQQQQPHGGLEEIEPQVIEFNVPSKMIPLQPNQNNEGLNPFRSIGFTEVTERPDQPVIIVTHKSPSSLTLSPSTPSSLSAVPTASGEVIRVGPKGRLLKKRRRIHPASSQRAQTNVGPTTQRTPVERVAPGVVPYSLPPLTKELIQQGQGPTTFRPNFNAVSSEIDDDLREDKATTYRSRFRYSPKASTEISVTSASVVASAPASSQTTGDQAQIIASRLKSLERQIRFKNRSKNV